MRSIQDLGYFERQTLIDRVGRAIAKAQGWEVSFEGNILESTSTRLHSCVALAESAIKEIETFMRETEEDPTEVEEDGI